MPELPEVETIRRQLDKEIAGKTVKSVVVRNVKPLNVSGKQFQATVSGKKITGVERRAKLLIFNLSGGWRIFFHLKMTGRMLLAAKNTPPAKHTHIVFNLSGGKDLFFEDYRRFGFVKLFDSTEAEKYLTSQNYGAEPLLPQFNYKTMKACLLAHPKKKIKEMLMNQSCIAGIGNIYAVEICFYAGVNPIRHIADITETELKEIFAGTKKILTSAVANRGTSADSYVDAYGEQGTFVPKLKVYNRANEKCLRCGGTIKKAKIAGRGTFWCPDCQK
jgi:formamidopyrimidine-DNA glycosylase